MNAILGFIKSVCKCDTNKHSVVCLDNTTVNITVVFQSHKNYTAQVMIDSVVNYIQGQYHAIVYLHSGWAVCLNADCEYNLDNSTTTMDKSDDNFIPQIVGLVVGTILCAIIVLLLCIFLMVRRMNNMSRLASYLEEYSCS